MADNVIIVSSDSHAGMPQELWPEYLPKQFHDLLPSLHQDQIVYPTSTACLGAMRGASAHPEHKVAHTTGWHGLHDAVLRMADMDREGVSAEVIYHGDGRLGDLFHNGTNKAYPLDAWNAGAKAWNRWAADNFAWAPDRFLVTGAIGPCVDIADAVAEIHWIADHHFVGTYGPGYLTHADLPPLYDPYWEPLWAAMAERNIAFVVHAGYGTRQGTVYPQLEKMYNDCVAAAGTTEFEKLLEVAPTAIAEESALFFYNFLNHSVPARRPMWQLMLSGVFDRHPGFRFMPTEIRLDWIPATLRHLDKVYAEHRAEIPAKKTPSEYWHANCLAGASFIHKVEVEMRHDIGIDTILFGRDYPHAESTWPHTADWLRDAFRGVPEGEVRAMLGENAIRFFGLDRARLEEIARRIGPSIEAINAGGDVRPDLIENFAARGGYLKPAEGEDKLPEVDAFLEEDLPAIRVAS